MPLDDQGGWYRFHPRFAQLLRVELNDEAADARRLSCPGRSG